MKEIQTTHNKPGIIASDEYYTPPELIRSLGHFDLDPAAPVSPRWSTADIMFDRNVNGLKQQWNGRVWCNPPYSAPLITDFVSRMAEHRNGILLLIPKMGSKLFRELVLPNCDALFLLENRIRFYDFNYVQQKSPIAQNVLIAFGEDNVLAIRNSGLKGTFLFPENRFTQCYCI